MSFHFIHLSDIHFGQETGGIVHIHNDVKERLIEDVRCVSKNIASGRVNGIIVTGDIAFGGRSHEYSAAGNWLDQVADAAGCEQHDIQIVPGNHDIDRGKITEVTRLVLNGISTGGDRTLDEILAVDSDRELLFRRFTAYRPFADAYRCPLSTDAELEERVAELAPGRLLRFVRMNSALICSDDNQKGSLLLGARQRVLLPRPGEEIVVLCHHPVHWLQDSEDALRFLRARARVFMSGHEHVPSLAIKTVERGKDLMMLAAGATVPPSVNEQFVYHYSFIEFAWDRAQDALSVSIHPRVWIDDKKEFGVDERFLSDHGTRFVLGCPYYRNAPQRSPLPKPDVEASGPSDTILISSADQGASVGKDIVSNDYPVLLLRFFRDLSAAQRKRVLVSLGGAPEDWEYPLNESFERNAFDLIVQEGRIDDLREAITEFEHDGLEQ